jgi:hypothetical protein
MAVCHSIEKVKINHLAEEERFELSNLVSQIKLLSRQCRAPIR